MAIGNSRAPDPAIPDREFCAGPAWWRVAAARPLVQRRLIAMLANGGTLLLSNSLDGECWHSLVCLLLACLVASVALHGTRCVWTFIPASRRCGVEASMSRQGIRDCTARDIHGPARRRNALHWDACQALQHRHGHKDQRILVFGVRSREEYDQSRSWTVQTAVLDRLSALPGGVGQRFTGYRARRRTLDAASPGRGLHIQANENEEVAFNAIALKYFSGTPTLSG